MVYSMSKQRETITTRFERIDAEDIHAVLKVLDAIGKGVLPMTALFSADEDDNDEVPNKKMSPMQKRKKLLNDLQETLKMLTNGRVKREYKVATGCPAHIGRIYTTGLQSFPRKVRYMLAKLYLDVDMENAHPRMLLQLAIQHNLPHAMLEDYVQNREQRLSDLCKALKISREKAKKEILKLMNYNARTDYEAEVPTWLVPLAEEFQILRDEIAELYPDHKKIKENRDYNIEGSTMNLVLCTIERQCLFAFIAFFESKGLEVDVLAHDGLMPIKNDEITQELLDEATEYVFLEKGYRLPLAIKEMDVVLPDMEDKNYLIDKAEAILEEQLCDTSSRVRNVVSHPDRYTFHFGTRIATDCPSGHTHTGECFQIDLCNDGQAYYRCNSKECEHNKEPYSLGRWKEKADSGSVVGIPPPADMREFDISYVNMLYDAINDEKTDASLKLTYMSALIKYTNKFLAVIGGKNVVIVEETFDERGFRQKFIYRKINETKALFENCQAVMKLWFRSEKRRAYKGFVCSPKGTTSAPKYYNMFNGLKVERQYNLEEWKCDETKIDLILKHLFEVICASNKKVYHFVLTWCKKAFIEQKKTRVAIIITGPMGSGKSLIVHKFLNVKVVGCPSDTDFDPDVRDAGCTVHTSHALFTNFNGLLHGRLLVVVDEAGLWENNTKQVQELKSKITEPTAVLEEKFVNSMNTQCFNNFVLTTNEEHPIKVEPQDRRFLILHPSNHRMGDKPYFDALCAQIEADGSAAHFYKYLESYECDTGIVGDRNELPMTTTKRELLEHALAPEVKFVIDLVEKEQPIWTLVGQCWEPVKDGEFYPATTVYDTYCKWWDENGMSAPYRPAKKSRPEFQKQFLKITGLVSEKRLDKRGVIWNSTANIIKKLGRDGYTAEAMACEG